MARNNNPYKKTKVKKPAGAPDQVVIQKIEVRPYNRTEQDIPNWRRAVQSAESQIPRRNLLYNLYADVDLDGHVEAVTSKRKDPIKAANWQFVDKDGTAVDAVNDLIDSIGFDDLLDEIINSKFWGYSIMEPTFWKDQDGSWEMDAGLLPRLNYRPEIGILAYDHYGDDGLNIRKGMYAKTIMEVGKVIDLGLYMKAAPYAVLKRGGLGDYAAFIQTFGNPLIDAMWNGFDEKQRQQLQTALDNIGAGGTIIRPEGTTIEIKENNTKDTSDSHGSFLRFLNVEISKALLGTTETTESSASSGHAQSKVHQEQDDTKHETDLSFVRKVLNSRFIRILQSAGFETMGGRFIIQGESQELSKKESFEMHKMMVNELGLPIDHDFFYETYDVPKPDNYEQLMKEKENPPNPKEGNDPDDEDPAQAKKEKDKAPPSGDEDIELTDRAWYQKLFDFFLGAPTETIGASCGDCHTIDLSFDQKDQDAFIQRIWDAEGKASYDGTAFRESADTLLQGFKDGWQEGNTVALIDAPGFTYGGDDPALLTAFEQNIFRFSGAKTLWEVQQLNSLFRQTTSFSEFYQAGKKFLDRSRKDYLQTEYNTAQLTGEAAATYYRLIGQAEIFPYWKYTTAGDPLVRRDHAQLDGIILPVNDPIWDQLYPPNGWNCRCYIVPRMRHEFDESKLAGDRAKAQAYLDSPRFEREAKSGFGINRAKRQLVFSENQRYVKRFSKDPDKTLSKLGASDYGLADFYEMKKRAAGQRPTYAGTATQFYDALEDGATGKILRDYHNRPVIVGKKEFDNHTKDGKKKRAHRVQLLSAVTEGLREAQEVWLTASKLTNYTYIHYYRDVAVQINVRMSNGVMRLIGWFEIAEKDRTINNARKGLLIKR